MNEREKHGRVGRGIVERLQIDGKLVLDTPAHLGSGEAVGLTDMSLLRDPCDGRTPLLTGASLAGALRNYLHEYERGYGQPEVPGELACRQIETAGCEPLHDEPNSTAGAARCRHRGLKRGWRGARGPQPPTVWRRRR